MQYSSSRVLLSIGFSSPFSLLHVSLRIRIRILSSSSNRISTDIRTNGTSCVSPRIFSGIGNWDRIILRTYSHWEASSGPPYFIISPIHASSLVWLRRPVNVVFILLPRTWWVLMVSSSVIATSWRWRIKVGMFESCAVLSVCWYEKLFWARYRFPPVQGAFSDIVCSLQ